MRHYMNFDLFLDYGQYRMENVTQKYTVNMITSYLCGGIKGGYIPFQDNLLYQINSKNIVNTHLLL